MTTASNSQKPQAALVANCAITATLIAVDTVYFCYVMRRLKLRQSFGTQLGMLLAMLAMAIRFAMAIYVSVPGTDQQIVSNFWWLVSRFYTDCMFEAILLTLVFRMLGSWGLFSEIQTTQLDIEKQVKSLQLNFWVFLCSYTVLTL